MSDSVLNLTNKQTNKQYILLMKYKLYVLHIIQEYNIYKIVITILITKTTEIIYIEGLVRTPNGEMTQKNNLQLSQDHFLRAPIT